MSIIYSSNTNNYVIASIYGLKNFLKKTYLCTGGAICSSIGLSKLGAFVINTNKELLSDSLPMLFKICPLMMIGGVLAINLTNHSFNKKFVDVNTMEKKIKIEILYSTNSIQRTLSYISMIIEIGLIMIPMFVRIPDVVFPAFIASAIVFGSATWYGMTRKYNDELEKLGPTLFNGLMGLFGLNGISLIGLIGISLFGLGSYLIFGNNWFGDITHLINLYGGILLYTVFVAYDTYQIFGNYNIWYPDHLRCSLQLYLDFINMFIRFMQIINFINNDKKNSDDDNIINLNQKFFNYLNFIKFLI